MLIVERRLAVLLVLAFAAELAAQSGGHSVDTPGAAPQVIALPQPGPASDPFPRKLTDASGATIVVPQAPQRIVSTDAALDEFLAAVADAKLVAGTSAAASNAGQITALKPDLVLISSRQGELIAALTASKVPVYRVDTNFRTLQQIEKTIAVLGYVLGTDKTAARAGARLTATVYNGASKNNASGPRVLVLNNGLAYGTGTLIADILTTIGAANVAQEAAGETIAPNDRIVAWNPDWIVAAAAPGQIEAVKAALMKDLATTNAAKNGHIAVIDSKVLTARSPQAGAFVQILAETVYP